MQLSRVLHIIGTLVLCLAATMLVPLAMAFLWHESETVRNTWIVSVLATGAAGLIVRGVTPPATELGRKEGCTVVSLSWLALAFFGALPFRLSGMIPSFTDAYFETMSGLTTCGASILPVVEALPRSLLFWRSLLHWLGGMGIIVLGIAILPFLGVGGMQLFRAEVAGVSKDRLTPRIASTARLLWGVYLALTLMEILLLRMGGMPWFDSVCNSFSTIATGGFAVRTASIGAYHSVYIESVVIVFMVLSGLDFTLHYRLVADPRQRWSIFRDPQARFFVGTILVSIGICTVALVHAHTFRLGAAVRHSAFSVASIATCTGFATEDFATWPFVCQFVLALLMFVGACAGSTGGGIKVIRFILLLRHAMTEIRRTIFPFAVQNVRWEGDVVSRDTLATVFAFFFLYVSVFAFATLLLTAVGVDIVSAFSGVISCMGAVGPGLNVVGPHASYAVLPASAKWVLSACMLIGRLEIYTVFVLALPSHWKH